MSSSRLPELTVRAAQATWWSGLEIAARYSLHFVVVVVLARMLGPDDFGLLAMVTVFTTFSTMLVEGGLGIALVQKGTTTDDEETSVLLVAIGAAVVLALALWVLAPSIAGFYRQSAVSEVLRLMVWVLPLSALVVVPNALLSQRLDFRKRALAELVASGGAAVGALWLAWRGHGVWSLAWQAIIGGALRAAMLWLLTGWWPHGRFRRGAYMPLLRFSSFLLAANILNVLGTRLQSLLIGRYFAPAQLGYYAMAQDTQQAPTQLISSLLNRVGLPAFVKVADRPQKLAGALCMSLRVSTFLFMPCMVGIAALALPLVTLLFGRDWAPVAPILALLALSAAVWPLHLLNLAALGARGRSELMLRLEIAKALLTMPMIVLAAPYGPLAVAAAVLVSGLGSVAINGWYSKTILSCGLGSQLREVAPIVLLSCLSVGLGWLAGRSMPTPIGSLAVAIVVAVPCHVLTAALLGMQAWRDFIGLVAAMRHRTGGQP